MRAIILTALMVCGCSSDRTGGNEGAQFRYIARDVYSKLYNPSCSAPSGFHRLALLRGETGAFRDFGREIAGTMAAQQLLLAQQDAAYEQMADSRCWNDGDIRFAEIHVQMAKKAARDGLPKLRSISRELRRVNIESAIGPQNRANFRYIAKKIFESSQPLCQIATGDRDKKIMTAARREVDRFRQSLSGGPFALQFEFSQADADYIQSITEVSCAEPSAESTAKLSAEVLEGVRDQISEIRKTMK